MDENREGASPMNLTERAAYLKGLRDGMKLDQQTDEGKLLHEIISLLADVASAVDGIDDMTQTMSDEMDDLEEEIDGIEEVLDELIEYDGDEDPFGDDDGTYEICCPECGERIVVDEAGLVSGVTCPNCGAVLDFDIEPEEEDGEPEE